VITLLLPLLEGWEYVGQDIDARLKEKGWDHVPARQSRVLYEIDKPGWLFGVGVEFQGSKYSTLRVEYYDAVRGYASVTLSPYGMHRSGFGYSGMSGLVLALYDEENDHYTVAFMPSIPFPIKASPTRKARVIFESYDMDSTLMGVELAGVVITDMDAFLKSLREVYGIHTFTDLLRR